MDIAPATAASNLVTPAAGALVQPAYAPAAPQASADTPLELVTSPELRRFDLADYRKPAARAFGLAAARKAAPTAGKADKSTSALKTRTVTRLVDEVLYRQTGISFAGQPSGDIAVRIGPDMKPSIKVGDLLGLVSSQMDSGALARLSAASAAQDYVSFADLRSAGFDVQYSAGSDSIAITIAS